MRILLGMSGGLDSSYSALKLIEEGHSVEGAVLIMHDYTELDSARASARELGIKLHEIDCRELFAKAVIPDFISQYRKGRTPNPCVICNREVKFKVLLDYAMENGFGRIATGHYARICKKRLGNAEKSVICRAGDLTKDQTYMLWRLPREVIDKLLLPLSDLTKDEVRYLAGEKGISSAEKKESQEICFIPSGDYAGYIENIYGKSPEGEFVDENGNVVGKHKGIIHYTVGQRKGLGIALGQRAFITDINPLTDKITVSFSAKETNEFTISDIVFSGCEEMPTGSSSELYVKIRYQAPPVPARIEMLDEKRARVLLSRPAKSVTSGQSAVFYDGDALAFGGFID